MRQLESQGEPEIQSTKIGELVMDGLRSLDSVAYVRFASVYRNFREARDFNTLIDELAQAPPDAPGAPEAPEAVERTPRSKTPSQA